MKVRRGALLITAILLLGGLAAPARADYFNTLQDLATGHDHHAPLIPLVFPKKLGSPATFGSLAETNPHAYSLTFNRPRDLLRRIVLERGVLHSLTQLHRERQQLDRVSHIKVRGHRGELRVARFNKDVMIDWVEGGKVLDIQSSDRRYYTAKDLMAMARSLDPIRGAFGGSNADQSQSAVAVVTAHTISFDAAWSATCTDPDTSQPVSQGGDGVGNIVPLHNGAFSATNLPTDTDLPNWSNQVSGKVGSGSVQIAFRATGSFAHAVNCDSGAQSVTLTPISSLP